MWKLWEKKLSDKDDPKACAVTCRANKTVEAYIYRFAPQMQGFAPFRAKLQSRSGDKPLKYCWKVVLSPKRDRSAKRKTLAFLDRVVYEVPGICFM